MYRVLFVDIIRKGVQSGGTFFDEKADCCGLPSASTDQKLAAAFRTLAYRVIL
jgi:hypothetical protein